MIAALKAITAILAKEIREAEKWMGEKQMTENEKIYNLAERKWLRFTVLCIMPITSKAFTHLLLYIV